MPYTLSAWISPLPSDGVNPPMERVAEQISDGTTFVYTRNRVMWVATEEEAARERERQERQDCARRERIELEAACTELTPREDAVYMLLNGLIDEVEMAGADVSYFPHAAQMALVEYAKKIAALKD